LLFPAVPKVFSQIGSIALERLIELEARRFFWPCQTGSVEFYVPEAADLFEVPGVVDETLDKDFRAVADSVGHLGVEGLRRWPLEQGDRYWRPTWLASGFASAEGHS